MCYKLVRRWLVPFLCIWFAIGAFSYHRRLSIALREIRSYGLLQDPLKKRDVLYPQWSECVRALRQTVPRNSDLLLLCNVDDETWGLLTLQLKYETYPDYYFYAANYREVLPRKPTYLLIYGRPPGFADLRGYNEIYRGSGIAVLKRQ
ncbi:MAG TPA: hypothetical protein VGK99_15905 [Acidobacteriota bacterium]